MKVVIYSRYSTDQQDASSISGQVANCEALAMAKDWQVVERYKDEALSGSDDNRPGYKQLLADSEAALFDGIVVDETSRLTRRPGELSRLLEELAFRRQFIVDCKNFDSRDQNAALLASVYGGIDSLELIKIKQRTHRGLRERAKQGFSAGGKTYGYDSERIDPNDPDSKWRKVINEDQANWVVWIFEQYAAGLGGKRICAELNRLKVPSAGADWKRTKRRTDGKWQHSALLGQKSRGNGILRNELYIGRVIWNRGEWIKKPGTNTRVYRPRPDNEWIISEQPELRIVPQDLWNTVQARLNNPRAAASRPGRRGKYLLTGLLLCDECGGSLTLIDKRCYGCGTRHRGGDAACSNPIRLKRTDLEDTLLADIRKELLAPEILPWIQREVTKAMDTPDDTGRHESELIEIDAEIARIVDAIAQIGLSAALQDKLTALEQRKLETESELSMMRRVSLFPASADIQRVWTGLVENLGEAHEKMSDVEMQTTRNLVKSLIGQIRVARDKTGSADLCLQSVVAGAGFEPATFGL